MKKNIVGVAMMLYGLGVAGGIAAAENRGQSPITPDFILKDCQETLNGGDSNWAVFGVDPAGSLAVYIGNRDRRDIYGTPALLSTIKITLLEETKHGELAAEIDNNGNTSYRFDPEPGYLGKDRAVFMAEFEGKRYKIVIDLVVGNSIDEYNPVCPKPRLIKVAKPSSGSNEQ